MGLTVGFDATSAVRQTAGIGRYTRELLASFAAMDHDTRFRLYYFSVGADRARLPILDSRFRVRSLPLSDRVANAAWHRAGLRIPVELVIGRFDLFHSPDFTLPPTMGRPTVLTVHDLAFMRVPDCAYPTLRAYLEESVPRSARRATRIIAVSESTRRDIIDLLEIPPDRIVTVLEGVGSEFRPPADFDGALELVRLAGVTGPFILSASTLEPRKNYVRLLQAYALLLQRGISHRLVIAGRPGWLYEPIYQAVDTLRLHGMVHFLQPDDVLLSALYGTTDAFVFPSIYEGFGITPLEALACGAPVACSSVSSMPEVVGDAALLFDPVDVEGMARAVEVILSDADTASRLRAAGPERAARFSWDRAARETLGVYGEALQDG